MSLSKLVHDFISSQPSKRAADFEVMLSVFPGSFIGCPENYERMLAIKRLVSDSNRLDYVLNDNSLICYVSD